MTSESLFSNNGNFFHHAYLIQGGGDEIRTKIQALIEQEKKVSFKNNPDVLYFDNQNFGIDESRAVKAAQMKLPVNGEHTLFFISFQVVTFEAQNSLLKVFEDPGSHNIFFIFTPNVSGLLPTLRSRLHTVAIETDQETHGLAKKFLSSSKAERISMVKDFIEKKDKKEVMLFLSSLESSLHTHWRKNQFLPEMTALKEVMNARDFVNDRASSIKLLLEHISLIIPQVI